VNADLHRPTQARAIELGDTDELSPARRRRGRPRRFDRGAALAEAMRLFWERGYEVTSIADLTAAMGMKSPSLYAAFKDKESLFLEAITLYVAEYGNLGISGVLEQEPSARKAIERWLLDAAYELTSAEHPRGCMVVSTSGNRTASGRRVNSAMAQRRFWAMVRLGCRIDAGVAAGELPADTDAERLATFYMTVYQGMALQARDGASTKALIATVRQAMLAWPRRDPLDVALAPECLGGDHMIVEI